MKDMMKALIILAAVINLALCFCGNHTLHGNLAESAVQVSNWLREHYRHDVTRLEHHVTSSMIVALRLAGYLPHTIVSDFKTNDSYTIVDYLKSHLDNHKTQDKTLSNLRPGHIANIFQAVSALCYDPQNFYGHNLTKALFESFESHSTFKNYFEHSSVAVAVCQSLGTKIQPNLARSILLEMNKTCITQNCTKRPDTVAMTLMALSCLRRNIAENKLLQDVDETIKRYLKNVVDALRKRKDRLWNAQSKGLLVQAIMSVPKELRPRHWHCNRLLSAILDKHDPLKAFGNVLANIQVLPALLGRSLVHLKMSCPTSNSQEVKRNKTVCVKLDIQDPTKKQKTPEKVVLVVPEKTTAYEILKRAAENNNEYIFDALQTSYGRMIKAISGVVQDPLTGHYWALYESENVLARDGVDLFIPKNNTCIIFKYEQCVSVEDNNTGDNLA